MGHREADDKAEDPLSSIRELAHGLSVLQCKIFSILSTDYCTDRNKLLFSLFLCVPPSNRELT